MSDNSDPRRDAIHQFLNDQGPADMERNAVLVGWVIVCDWMDDEGERWLSKAHSSSITTWGASGMHHDALYGTWPEGDE